MAYNPDQPREDDGRWADGGGSGAGVKAAEKFNAPIVANENLSPVPSNPDINEEEQRTGQIIAGEGIQLDSHAVAMLEEYQQGGSSTINNVLRGEISGTTQQQRDHVEYAASTLKRGIDTQPPIKDDILVHRGVPIEALIPDIFNEKVHDLWDTDFLHPDTLTKMHAEKAQKLIGVTLEDKGFFSTSTSRNVARESSRGAVLEISVPKGTRGIFMPDHTNSIEYGAEQEFLMQAGTKIRITGVYRLEHYEPIHFQAELVK